MGVKDNAGEGLERREESCGENVHCLREDIQHPEQDVSRNMSILVLLVSSQPEMRNGL